MEEKEKFKEFRDYTVREWRALSKEEREDVLGETFARRIKGCFFALLIGAAIGGLIMLVTQGWWKQFISHVP